ncbi:hypothetical protein BJ508DRAFT_315661 [Ascobolus immersus RN42]|uniref:Uncharacterized protein n=1 Tax=Ascobolus immersus RN42 TaxID=1160509 RepID=A0A3N4HG72_ASCIM|nr:hypothetical protein BJ508DRAFT_315661 [Ascobolus immersus RN42]
MYWSMLRRGCIHRQGSKVKALSRRHPTGGTLVRALGNRRREQLATQLQDDVKVSSYDCDALSRLGASEVVLLGEEERCANVVKRCVFGTLNSLHDKRFVTLVDRTIWEGFDPKLLVQERNATAGIQTGQEAALQGGSSPEPDGGCACDVTNSVDGDMRDESNSAKRARLDSEVGLGSRFRWWD